MERQQAAEVLLGDDEVLGVIGEEGVAGEEEGGCGEDLEELVEGVGEGGPLLEELEGGVDVEDEGDDVLGEVLCYAVELGVLAAGSVGVGVEVEEPTSSTRDISEAISSQQPQFMGNRWTLRIRYSSAFSLFFSLARTMP